MYKLTQEAFGKYLESIAEVKFGGIRKAAGVAGRSREHYFNCVKGRAGLDSARRLALKLSASSTTKPGYFAPEISPWETVDDIERRAEKAARANFKSEKKVNV